MLEEMGKNADIIKALKKKEPVYVEIPGDKPENFLVKGVTHLGKRILLAHARTGMTQSIEAASFFTYMGFTKDQREEATIALMLMCK